MSLNAEHANALQSKDEVRQCDNCERWLLDRTRPDWPWNHTVDESGYVIFCYESAVKKGLTAFEACDDSHPAVGACVLPKNHKGSSHKTKDGVKYGKSQQKTHAD